MARLLGRRSLLGWLAGIAGGVLGLGAGWWQYTSTQDGLVSRVAEWVGASEDARALGRAYLAGQPEEANRETLTRLVAAQLEWLPFGLSDQDLREWSRATIARDFQETNTVTLQGWIFSRTEIRLCGLAALRSE